MLQRTQSFITEFYAKHKKHGGHKGLDRFSKRYAILTVIIGVMVALVIGNLFKLTVLEKDKYRQAAASQQLYSTTLPANRGTIYDINGEKLVQSAAAWIVVLEPKTLHSQYTSQEREEILHTLSEVLGISYETVLKRSEMNANQVKLTVKADKGQKDKLTSYINRDVYTFSVKEKGADGKEKSVRKVVLAEEIASKVIARGRDEYYIKGKDLGYDNVDELKLTFEEKYQYIKGILLYDDTQRYYYHDTPIAANVLGYTNFDNQGSQGIEAYYDSELRGVDGKKLSAKNSVDGDALYEYNANKDPIDGNSITLTMDANIQSVLEKYLRQAVEDNDVQNRAAGIVMNVNTGAILAMASMPDYDPNDYQTIADPAARKRIAAIANSDQKKKAKLEAQQTQWKNKAVNDTYEPGSVFKPITMSAALEEGVTTMDDTFNCPGYRMVGKRKIRCGRRQGHGHETLTQGMMNSCNPVLMELGIRLGTHVFSQYFKSYGLTAATGIDLPGESAGLYHPEDKMTELDLAESAYGQSTTVTPIQMITSIAAVVNGGYLLKPYIVDKITDPNGNIVRSNRTLIKRQVISEETSAKMREILEATANKGGTAHNVYLPGYRIGGKTGTSEKITKQNQLKDGRELYVASFVGIAPINDPEVIVLVMLDEPNGKRHTGGSIAAPVVRNIFSEILPYLGVDTIYSEEDMKLMDYVVPDVTGQSTEEAQEELEKKGYSVRVIGEGKTVNGQIPVGGKTAPRSCTIVLSTETDGKVPTTTVPDFIGMSPTQVAREVSQKHLNIRYAGTGYDSADGVAKTQEIPAGSVVEEGTVITVDFIVNILND